MKLHQGASIGRLNEILEFIRQTQGTNTSEISAALNISVRTLCRELKKLKEEGLIELRGAPRNGGYFIGVENRVNG